MRALSLTQPYASAIALLIKRWETRSWPTSYRGEVCIHASKGFPGWAREFADLESMNHPGLDELPLGAIVCIADLTECCMTSTIGPYLSEQERHWGDYSGGRYAFKFENVRVLFNSVPAKGALSFWTLLPETERQVLAALAETA